MRRLFFLVCFGLISYNLIHPSLVSAEVVISEVMSAPNSGHEWVEIYNTASVSAVIKNWWLEDQLANPTVISIISTTELAAQQYLVIELSSNKLNNDQDGVVLKNDLGLVIDQMSYQASQNGLSWNRPPIVATDWYLSEATQGKSNIPLLLPTPTPILNSTASPSPSISPSPFVSPSPSPENTSPSIFSLSEIMACPKSGESEWIEFLNQGQTDIVLVDWKVVDAQDNKRNLSLTIPGQGLAVIEWPSGFINNSGDTLSLQNNHQQTVVTVETLTCQSGQSQIFEDQSWQITDHPSKNLSNQIMATPLASALASPGASPIGQVLGAEFSPSPVASTYQPSVIADLEQVAEDEQTFLPTPAPNIETVGMFNPTVDYSRIIYLMGFVCFLIGLISLGWWLKTRQIWVNLPKLFGNMMPK